MNTKNISKNENGGGNAPAAVMLDKNEAALLYQALEWFKADAVCEDSGELMNIWGASIDHAEKAGLTEKLRAATWSDGSIVFKDEEREIRED